ncbi:MAG TPA: hypothetical protein VK111_14305 [Virgibacillus sp.]|nr:hypothetical protein [Virgibacillus sp.]
MEKLLWSIALPGFGQILNGKYIKGFIFVFLEFLINVKAHLNDIILSSFQGDIQQAIEQVDYQWLLFYPCLYFFVMWDAFRDAGGGKSRHSYLPFVFAAYIMTLGVIYSSIPIWGVLFGPVWLPILSVIPGLLVGYLVKKIVIKVEKTP